MGAEVVALALEEKLGPLDFMVEKENNAHAKYKHNCFSGGGHTSYTRTSM